MAQANRFSLPDTLSLYRRNQQIPKVDPNTRAKSMVVNFEEEEEVWAEKPRHSSISSEDSSELAVFACARQRQRSQQQLWETEDVVAALSTLPGGQAALDSLNSPHDDELVKALHECKDVNLDDTTFREHRLSVPSFASRFVRKASLAAENEAAAAATPGELISKWPNTCLLIACFLRKFNVAKTLLDRGVPVTICDNEGRTPLHLAASTGAVEIIDELLNHGAQTEVWDYANKCTPLHCAAAASNVAAVKLLLKAGADVNAGLSSKTALHYAVSNDAGDCVDALLQSGACPNNPQVYTETPLHVAASLGSARCVKLLLQYGADVRVQLGPARQTPLHLAAEEGNAECTKLLLEAGAPWDARNSRGQTAMHLAALAQSTETIELLIAAANDMNIEDSDGRTPLHAAVAKSMRGGEVVKMLIRDYFEAKEKLDLRYTPAKSISGTQKFHAIIPTGSGTLTVSLAIIAKEHSRSNNNNAGAIVNKSDKFGYTPLHTAALNENSSLVVLLLTKGADITARTKGGVSAFSFIVRRTPDVLPRYITCLDQAISLHDHELGDVDCELRLDFRPLISGGRGETDVLLCLIDVGQRHILQHPLCESFLYLKWLRIRKFFLFSLFFHLVFVALFTAYVLVSFFFNLTEIRSTLFYPVLVFTCMLGCKEMFQLAHGITGYATRWENWLQWSVIVASGLILIKDDAEWQNDAAALGILFAWIELMIVVGRFPMFGLYIQMFTQVSINFFKFLVAYSCLIVGFSLGLSVLFKKYKSFRHPLVALIKTIIMMSGELEFDDIFFDGDNNDENKYSSVPHLMFLAFVILVTIILTNLLVGLAVSDIQELQRSAGLDRLIRRAELVAHLESLLFSKLLDYAPIKIVKLCRKGALLLHPPHHCAVHIRPNDPRERRLPRELIKSVYRRVTERKNRNKMTKRASIPSFNDMDVVGIRMSRLISTTSTGDYSRQQLLEVAGEMKRFSCTFKSQLDCLTSKVESISRELEKNGQ